jgi:outer membrane protein OmpA-like peptidoglycan-associated protein
MKFNLILPLKISFLFLAALIVAACGGPPANNPLLETARSEFEAAERDSSIVVFAPVALKEAEEELQKSIRFWEAKEDKVLVDHHAYLAKQRTAIARETARLNMAQLEIERAEPERQRVLIDIRRADAIRAEERARAALEEAQLERREADRARERAEELSRRVEELEAERTDRGLVLTLGDVLFDFDQATLRPGAARTVANLASFMEEYPERNILIEGFTDSIGSDWYNEELSRRRADSVRRALLEEGVSSRRIEIVGYGKRFPVASNETEAGRQQNRRVEVIISDREGNIPQRRN